MRPFWKDMLAALFLGLVLPGLMLNAAAILSPEAPEELVPQTTQPELGELDTYLVGVVLAEMPASFAPEALKAQAVAARTYARKAQITGGKHGDGSVCRESSCCQAYITQEDYLARGGTQAGLDKVREAVASTAGQVLVYDGALIEATYFSCSGGSTETAVAVWGTDVPYLQSVESPGEEGAAHFRDTVSFTPEEFQRALGAELEGWPGSWFGEAAYTEGGGVETLTIGGREYSGIQLRSLLGLKSTNFTVTAGANVTITTQGYGHRVGMSQYGAEAMAAAGSGYEEILAHYYPGTELTVDSWGGG